MTRQLTAALLALSFATAAQAQGPVQRAGQAIDNAGKTIRRGVEGAVTRGQISAQERDLLGRVSQRLTFDKQMVGSALQLTVQADGAVVLQGSVADESSKRRAVDLAQSTLGVTTVVDELAVARGVTVIQGSPTPAPARVIIAPPTETRVVVPPWRVVVPPSRVVVPPGTEVIVPGGARVIEKR